MNKKLGLAPDMTISAMISPFDPCLAHEERLAQGLLHSMSHNVLRCSSITTNQHTKVKPILTSKKVISDL